ncbi:EamA family transporter [Virgibacillus xinjiangensis]|uniref:EamA family transporter n=1 Tax=Virgibacillus xinjiangensis TaxID=393090 RepID=A0ABV7CU02_9BACI
MGDISGRAGISPGGRRNQQESWNIARRQRESAGEPGYRQEAEGIGRRAWKSLGGRGNRQESRDIARRQRESAGEPGYRQEAEGIGRRAGISLGERRNQQYIYRERRLIIHAYLFMMLVVFFYAGNILTGKALNDLPPITIAFFRLLVATMVLLPLGLNGAWQYRNTFIAFKAPFLLMTVTGITFFNTFIYWSLNYTTATKVSVLETAIPVVTVLLSAGILKEKLQGLQWAGVLLSFFGAVWVVLDGDFSAAGGMGWNAGDAIMLAAIASWAVYSICVKQYMHHFPAYGALFVMSGISLVVLFPLMLAEWMVTGLPAVSWSQVGGLFYLGIFPSFIALILYNHAVSELGPSKASVFLNFLPVVTMAGAYLWLGEKITLNQLFGATLVIMGVMLTSRSGESRRNRRAGFAK